MFFAMGGRWKNARRSGSEFRTDFVMDFDRFGIDYRTHFGIENRIESWDRFFGMIFVIIRAKWSAAEAWPLLDV